jgi:cytochrome P450
VNNPENVALMTEPSTPSPACEDLNALETNAFQFPASRCGCPFAPPADMAEIVRGEPVQRISLWDGSRAWLITRHADVRAVLRDSRFISAAHHDGFLWINGGLKAQCMAEPTPFIRLDGQDHGRIRNALIADFTPRRAEALRPRIQRVVDDCLDRMIQSGSPDDLLTALALPLPSLIICELLGVAYEDHAFFQDITRRSCKPLATERPLPGHSMTSRAISSS